MKKTIISTIGILCLLTVLAFSLTACGLKGAEKEVVGVYEVVEISIVGYPQVTASSYDYFTFEFKSNKKVVVKSKAGVNEYEQTAKWNLNDDGEIEVVTRAGFATATEKYRLEDGYLVGTNTGPDGNGNMLTMTVKFKKVS